MNTIIALMPAFLRAVGGVISLLEGTNAFSEGFSSVAEEVLSAAASLVERGDEAANELAALTNSIVAMGPHDPTQEQWADLEARSNAAHAAIQAPSAPA